MIVPTQIPNPYVKPRWQASVGIMESVVAYNCRKYGMPVPVLAMPMWEGAGNRAIDLSGNGNHGGLVGQPTWISEGMDFNGTTDYITKTSFTDMVATKAYSISYLLRTTQSEPTWIGRHILIRDAAADGFGTAPDINGKIFIYTMGGNTVTEAAAGTAVNDGKLHSIVCVFDQINDVVNVYVDGALDYSVAAYVDNSATTNATIFIGTDNAIGLFHVGILGNISVYDTAIAARQAKFIHKNQYFMYQLPEELYGYAAAAGVSIPVFLHHYNQLRGA